MATSTAGDSSNICRANILVCRWRSRLQSVPKMTPTGDNLYLVANVSLYVCLEY
jgi:hypothetical protein